MNRREVASAALAVSFAGGAAVANTVGPVLAVVTHPVADFAAWRMVYDEAAPVRDGAGVTGAEVFIDISNPLMMVVIHRFPTVEAAQGFFGNPDLAAAMQRGGVTAPPVVILATAV